MEPVHTNFTAAFTPGHVFQTEPELTTAFTHGYVFQAKPEVTTVRQVAAGTLIVPSGKIIACDPQFLTSEGQPFHRVAPRGRHPVILSIANLWGRDERVACARICFGHAKPARWVLALKEGQELSDLRPGEFYGYGVDSGTGCFIDAAASQEEDYGFFARRAGNALCVRGPFPGVLEMNRPGAPNLIGFETGLGDGTYASYWGLDRAGQIATLDTDFGLLIESVYAEVVIDGILERLGEPLDEPQFAEAGLTVTPRLQKRPKKPNGPFVVDIEGPWADTTISLLLGQACVPSWSVIGDNEKRTYTFRVARNRLTRNTKLQLRFVKGCRSL